MTEVRDLHEVVNLATFEQCDAALQSAHDARLSSADKAHFSALEGKVLKLFNKLQARIGLLGPQPASKGKYKWLDARQALETDYERQLAELPQYVELLAPGAPG
ncbi:hypothetical protein HYH02_013931 [Chlamydomonas schloesseri]|uniref:Uncharacterized protein n=1 Tax=Chlamydomonas schloesseri TaxID=2026947 RepID=A0A835T0Z3_9CHLO|nr:hypothetical protein HYH02_013931 [Chlamydomonas schloesseri]|eukprot:KAG2429980.1 hypothetical protein HYH02_013931 [Chlamydomonas schloesseri]